jgi:hypothetical protein
MIVYVLVIYCTLGCGKTPLPPSAMVFDSQPACDESLAYMEALRLETIAPDKKFNFEMRCIPAVDFIAGELTH